MDLARRLYVCWSYRVRRGSVRAGIRPSALTPQLQHLEHDLQGQLLVRGRRGHQMRLTDFGQRVSRAAQPYTGQLAAEETS
jgi:DNA-binding transcriptional LysR family regulator